MSTFSPLTIGFCSVCGKPKNATIVAGTASGALAFTTIFLMTSDWKKAILASILVGGVFGIGAYLTCRGVQVGLPIRETR